MTLSAFATNQHADYGQRSHVSIAVHSCGRRYSLYCAETDWLNYRRACRKANQLINASRSDH